MAFTAQTVTPHSTVGEDFFTNNTLESLLDTLIIQSLRILGCHEQLAFTAETVTLHSAVGKELMVLQAVIAFTTGVGLRFSTTEHAYQ